MTKDLSGKWDDQENHMGSTSLNVGLDYTQGCPRVNPQGILNNSHTHYLRVQIKMNKIQNALLKKILEFLVIFNNFLSPPNQVIKLICHFFDDSILAPN